MWPQLAVLLAGLWTMASPDILGYDAPARTIHHVIGPTVASIACVALWEIARGLRWVNVMLGVAMILAPVVQPFATPAAIASIASGAVVAIASLVRTPIAGRYGGGWRALWG